MHLASFAIRACPIPTIESNRSISHISPVVTRTYVYTYMQIVYDIEMFDKLISNFSSFFFIRFYNIYISCVLFLEMLLSGFFSIIASNHIHNYFIPNYIIEVLRKILVHYLKVLM